MAIRQPKTTPSVRLAPPAGSDFPRLVGEPRWALAESVLGRLAKTATPVVLWGHAGVGKSTLIQQFFNPADSTQRTLISSVLENGVLKNGDLNQRLLESADDLSRGYVFARRHELAGRLEAWRNARLQTPLWIVEDLHEIAGRTAAQQELSRLLDSRGCCDLPTLLTCAHWPLPTDAFRPALVSRLVAGLVIELPPAGVESRSEWAEECAKQRGVSLTEEATKALANAFPVSMAALRQALGDLLDIARRRPEVVAGAPIDLPLVRQFIAARRLATQPSLKRISERVAKEFAVSVVQLRSASRQQALVTARGAALWLARQVTDCNLTDLGKYFGGRDHATVLHALRTIAQRRATDVELADTLDRLIRQLEPTR